MDFLRSLWGFVEENPYLVLFGASRLIEVTPIKLNPWKTLFKWIGKQLNKDVNDKVTEIEKKVDNLQSELSDERVQNKRWSILNVSNSCRQGIVHTKEEWDHTLDEIKWYEDYCNNNKVCNGVIEVNVTWLRKKYHEHLENDDFLKD